MATLEERVQALEQENASRKKTEERLTQENTELKQKIELHTIAIGGLINKATLEAINEKNDNIFKALENHDKLTNMQLAELREKVEVDVEGKIVGMQTEMRQRFTELDGKIVGQQTEARQHFAEQDNRIAGLQTEARQRFTQVETTQKEHTTRLDRMEGILAQILARLPEKP